MLLDLAQAARKSGLAVIELDGWRQNKSHGGEDYKGVLDHHTGSYDGIADAKDDYSYAMWLAFEGRSDLPPPLCNLALSAEGVVYVCAAGNANHAGEAKASGPMPAVPDGNVIYIGIEAMNSGSQGWDSKALTLNGEEITQYEAYVRLNAALCLHYGWPASHVRAHKETSVTGKIDPAPMDMTKMRRDVARMMKTLEDDMPAYLDWNKEDRDALSADVAKALLASPVTITTKGGDRTEVTIKQAIARATSASLLGVVNDKKQDAKIDSILTDLDSLNTGGR